MTEPDCTADCTCGYPENRWRSGSGHKPGCADHTAWLASTGRPVDPDNARRQFDELLRRFLPR